MEGLASGLDKSSAINWTQIGVRSSHISFAVREAGKDGWKAQQMDEYKQFDQLALHGVYLPFFHWAREVGDKTDKRWRTQQMVGRKQCGQLARCGA